MMRKQQLKLTSQQGAALLVALVIMALVSVLGLSALRSSLFSGKIATVAQADAMAFEAAETALRVTYNEMSAMSADELFEKLSAGLTYCINDDMASLGQCSTDQYLDVRKLLQTHSVSQLDGYSPREGFDISRTGSGGIHVDYQISIYAQSKMESINLQNDHLQEVVKFGILPGSEIEAQ